MFSWICPTCGRECQPSEAECPVCVAKQAAPPPPPAYPPPPPYPPQHGYPPPPQGYPPPQGQPHYPPPPPQYQQPQQAYPQAPYPQQPYPPQYPPQASPHQQPPPQPQQPYYAVPPPSTGLPGWLISILVAAGIAAVGFGAFYLLRSPAAPKSAAVETAGSEEGTASAGRHPQARHVEITGLRLIEEKGKPAVRFVIVNHSPTDITGLEVTARLTTNKAAAGDPPVGTFKFNVRVLGAMDTDDITAPLETKARAYELPDWQFLKVEADINAAK